MNKLLILAAAVLAAGFAALFGGLVAERAAQPRSALAASQSAEDFKAGFALDASTATLVESLQTTLAASPRDEHTWSLLGLAYQQRARETGDPAYYTKSDGALRRALALDSKDSLVWSGFGLLLVWLIQAARASGRIRGMQSQYQQQYMQYQQMMQQYGQTPGYGYGYPAPPPPQAPAPPPPQDPNQSPPPQ